MRQHRPPGTPWSTGPAASSADDAVPRGPRVVERGPEHRRTFVVVDGLVALTAAGGAAALVAGVGTPDVALLAPLGLHSWVLPGLWLAASVAVPSGAAAVLAARRDPRTPAAVFVAAGLLVVELVVQVPVVGPSVLQAVMAVPASVTGLLALRARAGGTWGRVRRFSRGSRAPGAATPPRARGA
ncbi:hypothetical protein [Cellulomonas marina]|uniref:Uncharacterized protein n=1 Tax=Cellulomonas marina TaxID=988821 RepID=A0A1I0V300_9CELL|nr:hypothetical protein [Cellulomonas marina]GIG28292.1 hypothetical protein Cma02nite_08920 [Cellulomonas marina]SFA70622.1 hypothetical protein SAMN05421867_101119 [Cellulomonas marina]